MKITRTQASRRYTIMQILGLCYEVKCSLNPAQKGSLADATIVQTSKAEPNGQNAELALIKLTGS